MYLVATFLVILVPASGRHSLSFCTLIKLLHTPSTLLLACSYFCLWDSLNSVPRVYRNSPHPPNLRETGLWSWRGMLWMHPLKRSEHRKLWIVSITTLESMLVLGWSLSHETWITLKNMRCLSWVRLFPPLGSWPCLQWKMRNSEKKYSFPFSQELRMAFHHKIFLTVSLPT